jgi:hypothetical protein
MGPGMANVTNQPSPSRSENANMPAIPNGTPAGNYFIKNIASFKSPNEREVNLPHQESVSKLIQSFFQTGDRNIRGEKGSVREKLC